MSKLSLSLIVPLYNESQTIGGIIGRLAKQSKVIHQVVIVDDGSTDDSLKLAKRTLEKLPKVFSKKVEIYHKENGGKGSAVRFGLKKVTGSHVLIQDADLEYDPDDIPSLLEPLEKGRVEVVYGSRFLGPHSNLLFWHRAGNEFLNFVVNILFDTTLSDMETCYKVLPTGLMRQLDLRANSFELEPEITCKVLRRGIKIFEVPISYVGRDFTEGKKITWKDGFAALRMIFKVWI
ncbi:MAG: glycosyltransferase family 2 protein [Patescibacteria group bacterium]